MSKILSDRQANKNWGGRIPQEKKNLPGKKDVSSVYYKSSVVFMSRCEDSNECGGP